MIIFLLKKFFMRTFLIILSSGEKINVEADSSTIEAGVHKFFADKECVAMVPTTSAIIDTAAIKQEKKGRPDLGIRAVNR